MSECFYWTRRSAVGTLLMFGGALAVGVGAFFVGLSLARSGRRPPEWLVDCVGALVLALFLVPRSFGVLRNQMRLAVDEEGFTLPSGRRLPGRALARVDLRKPSDKPPVGLSSYWRLLPWTIRVSSYEDPRAVMASLRELKRRTCEAGSRSDVMARSSDRA